MSGFLPESDPDPLPNDYLGRPKFLDIDSLVDDNFESLKLEYLSEEGIEAIALLSRTVDEIFEAAGFSRDDDCTIQTEEYFLRRKQLVYVNEGRQYEKPAYWFIDKTQSPHYCRSWSRKNSLVNWCHNEQRHESAYDVRDRILSIISPELGPDSAMPERSFGRKVLAKLLHRN
ncbi:MAG TPA: hypothetical protein VGE13_02955 [Candidatus Saccharimonadales bacterium]